MRDHIANPTSHGLHPIYFVLIFAFTFFYVYIVFEPHQQAEMIRKQGGFIPGIRPGAPDGAVLLEARQPHHVVGALFFASVADRCRAS